MGGNRDRKEAMERNASTQDRIARTLEGQSERQGEISEQELAQRQALMDEILPYARRMLSDPGSFAGERSPFPDIERPDFTGQIRRDYFDDRADITQNRNQSLAEADDYFTASGLARSGIRTGAAGSIFGSAGNQLSQAKRTQQSRTMDEGRLAYQDKRDLALRKHDDTRGQEDRRLETTFGGLNALTGQQATLNPRAWSGMSTNTLGGAGATYGDANQSRYMAGQLPGTWSRIGSALGAGANIAGSIWGGGR